MILEEDAFLFLINVERDAADASTLERLDECGGVHQFPPARVDEERTGLHASEGFRVEQMSRLCGERQVQRDDVAVGQQGLKICVAHAQRRRPFGRGIWIVGQHFRAEPLKYLRRDSANSSRADHADGLAVEIEADQTAQSLSEKESGFVWVKRDEK